MEYLQKYQTPPQFDHWTKEDQQQWKEKMDIYNSWVDKYTKDPSYTIMCYAHYYKIHFFFIAHKIAKKYNITNADSLIIPIVNPK